jgi:hypothetical protein
MVLEPFQPPGPEMKIITPSLKIKISYGYDGIRGKVLKAFFFISN